MLQDDKLPKKILILPPNYHETGIRAGVQRVYSRSDGMHIIHGLENHDGNWWHHLSCSFENKLPAWEDLKEIKNIFIGRESKAIQILPSDKEFYNCHPFCLHLFSSSNDRLPNFLRGNEL